ncbi:MAG: stalk domain-containing protein, partial [Cellulosilyticaceae bacterium]
MKLRQKLAAVLAATMVVTAVPVVTMAASTNRITKTETVAKDEQFSTELVIKAEDTLTSGSVFFLEIAGGDFDKLEVKGGNVAVDYKAGSTTATVTATDENANNEIRIAIEGTAKDAETVLSLLEENTTLTGGKFVVARTTDAKGVVTAGDAKNLYTQGTIADIKIEESVAGSFKAGDEFTITLENDEYKFVNESKIVEAVSKGFLANGTVVDVKITDEDQITVTIKELNNTTARGMITISGIEVKSTVKAPETGELKVTVDGKKVNATTVKVANVAAYGSSLTVKDDKVVEFVAGNKKEVKFTLEENVDDSIVDGRTVEFKLEDGYFATGSSITVNGTAVDASNFIKEKIDGVERVVGFDYVVKADANVIDKYEIVATVDAAVDFAGTISIKADGRAIGDELTAELATVKAPFAVKAETATVKVGLKDQKAGKIEITETEKGMLNKGNIVIELEDEKGMEFTKAPKVETKGDIKVGEAKIEKKDGKVLVTVPVTRTSKEASTITISEFGMDVDRTVAEGKFDAKIGGSAIASNGTKVAVDGFVNVGTPNTEDVTNGMKKGTASFTIGAKTYTVNGTEKEMDAAAYVTASGRTMLPIRYVSEAFGIDGNNIIFTKADGTITILAGTRTLQMKNGSNIAVLNGASIKMDEKVVIKDGRTYVPVGEIGRLLGISVSF